MLNNPDLQLELEQQQPPSQLTQVSECLSQFAGISLPCAAAGH